MNAAGRAPAKPVSTRGAFVRWLAYYGSNADESVLASYDVVVLDPGYQGALSQVASAGARVCGYLSLGEIRLSDRSFARVDSAALLPPNPDWPGTRRVDVRQPSWRSLILDYRVPSLVSQGFTGLMLDTLDTPPYLEQIGGARCSGMSEAALDLVRRIRQRWPELLLIVNRGYALLPDIADLIDAVIAESLLTFQNPTTGAFAWVDRYQVDQQLMLLRPVKLRNPPLPILSLDYWNPDDMEMIASIYNREQELGHHPYVGTRLLDRIIPLLMNSND